MKPDTQHHNQYYDKIMADQLLATIQDTFEGQIVCQDYTFVLPGLHTHSSTGF